jgi:hypothetical protein
MKPIIRILLILISIVIVVVIGVLGNWNLSPAGIAVNFLQIPQIYNFVMRGWETIREYFPAFWRAIKIGRNLKPIIALLDAQEHNYRDYLSIRVTELVINAAQEKVNAKFQLSNKLLWDVSLLEFKGSAWLDSSVVSEDLKLSKLISNYQFGKCQDGEIGISFPIKPETLNQLKDKRAQKDKAYWKFDTKWNLQFHAGEKQIWEANTIPFEEIPRIWEGTNYHR